MLKMDYKFLVLFWTFGMGIHCQNLSDVRTLYTTLFSGYKKEVMPMADHSKPLEIGVTFYLASFNSFHEVDEKISITAGMILNWNDPSLTWDPESYGGLYRTIIKPSDLWLPEMFLANKVDNLEPIGDDTKFFTTIIFSGEVFYPPGGILNAKCPTDINKFPFDTQTCELKIICWGISSESLILKSVHDEAQLDFFVPTSDWELKDYSTKISEMNEYQAFSVTISVKRQPVYYSVTLVIPTLIFALLNPLVFVLPIESGERVSLAMTILLSYAVFMTLAAASIPKTSNPMCALLIVMILIMVVSGAIVVGTIMNAKYFYQTDDGKIGRTLKYLGKKYKRKNNVVAPDEKEQPVTGKTVAEMFDSVFLYGSYVLIIVMISAYFITVAT